MNVNYFAAMSIKMKGWQNGLFFTLCIKIGNVVGVKTDWISKYEPENWKCILADFFFLASKGDTVQIPVHEDDKQSGDSNNLLAVVMSVTKGGF